MSKLQLLRAFLNERLTAAVVEIFGAVEKTVAEYQEENDRLRGLLQKSPDIHHSLKVTLLVSEGEVTPGLQKQSPGLWQEDSEPVVIKEEQEEPRTSQKEEELEGLHVDNLEFRFLPSCVKSECGQEDPLQSLTIPQIRTEENRGSAFPSVDHTPFDTSTHLKSLAIPYDPPDHLNNAFSNRSTVSSDPVRLDSHPPLDPNQHMGEHCSQPSTMSKTHRCPDCGETFALKADLLGHVTLAKKRPSECCLTRVRHSPITELHVTSHVRHVEKHCTCPFCGKTLKYKGDLSRHMRIHTGEKPFSCRECGKSFNQKGHLIEHVRTHTGEKPFSCGDCGKSFIQKGDLRRHMLTHTGEKPFRCAYCGKSFIQKRDLRRHILTHTGEKSFSCDDCGKSFKRKGKLSMHILTHSGDNLHNE